MTNRTPTALLLALSLAAAACGGEGSSSSGGAAGDTARIAELSKIREKPRLANADSVRSVLTALYPADLKARGVGGEVVLRILVSQEGLPLAVEVDRSSGQPALDQASRQVANAMRFEPGTTDEGPAKVWVTFPVRWTVPADVRGAAKQSPATSTDTTAQ